MMRTIFGFVAISSALLVGCKDDKKAAPPEAAPIAPTGLASSAFPLRPGETYAGGKQLETNLVDWNVEDGSVVQLGIVATGRADNGRENGVLRAFHAGSETHDVGPTYSLDPAIEHWSELKLLPNNRVMFRYGEAGEGPRARNAVLLRWDADAKRVRIAKRWTGASSEPEPEWLLSGEYKVAPESEGLCLQVIARIVSCEGDAKFRDAIFRRDDVVDKAAMQEHFDTHVATWQKPGGAKAQCERWASAAYVDTHFSEPAKLKRLAAETKHDCGFFASEIVDEGGLPTALTEI